MCKKGKKDQEKFGYNIPKSSREVILLDKNNENTLWDDLMELENIGLFQFYPHGSKFEKEDGWKYVPMHMLFDVKQNNLQHKARLVVVRHVMYYMECNTYSYTTKYVSVILTLLISMKNGLRLTDIDI